MRINRNFIIIIILIFSILSISCEKKPTSPEEEIPENLFPLSDGKLWVYDVYETDLNGNPIPRRSGTAYHKVRGSIILSGKQFFVLIDSTIISDTLLLQQNYFHIDTRGNIYQAMGEGQLILIMKTFNREIGFEKINVALDTTMIIDGQSVRFKITSVIFRPISLTVPLGKFEKVYPADLNFYVNISGNVVQYNFKVYFVQNIGPIKFVEMISQDFGLPAYGYRIKELRQKNF